MVRLDARDVSLAVNSAKYDGPECIQPVSDDEISRAGAVVPVVSNIKITSSLYRPGTAPTAESSRRLLRGFEANDQLKLCR